MFDLASLAAYVAIVLALFLIPGPAVLLVLGRTVEGGRKVGIATGLGIALGDLIHTLFAAVGLSALLMTSSLAFSVVKYVGAAYLVYLGVRAFLAQPADPTLPKTTPITPARAFLEAIPAEVLNPKTALFFLAFLSQFVHPGSGSSFAQFMQLGLVFVLLSSVYTSLLALAIRPLGRVFKKLGRWSRWQGKAIGLLFISLGLKVATQQR